MDIRTDGACQKIAEAGNLIEFLRDTISGDTDASYELSPAGREGLAAILDNVTSLLYGAYNALANDPAEWSDFDALHK